MRQPFVAVLAGFFVLLLLGAVVYSSLPLVGIVVFGLSILGFAIYLFNWWDRRRQSNKQVP